MTWKTESIKKKKKKSLQILLEQFFDSDYVSFGLTLTLVIKMEITLLKY